jgi:hypothetical protein
MQRLRLLRDRIVWWFEEAGFSGMEPSHRPGHRVYRPSPREPVRNDEWHEAERRAADDAPEAPRPQHPR